jgi:eukaryotic-like serine/threonine-protein kinase
LGYTSIPEPVAGLSMGPREFAAGGECRLLYGRPRLDNEVFSVEFSPGGQLMVSTGADGAHLWDVAAAREVGSIPIGPTEWATFCDGGRELFTSGRTGLRRWPIDGDLATGETRIGNGEVVGSGAATGRGCLSPDGSTLAVIESTQIRVLDPRNTSGQFLLDGQPGLDTVAISPDGRWIAAGALRGQRDEKIRVWSVRRKTWRDLPVTGRAFVAFSPDGQWLITGRGPDYRCWKVGTWEPGTRFPRADDTYAEEPMAITRDGRMGAIARSLQLAQLIDLASGRELATLEAPDPQPLSWFSFSRDGSRLAAAGQNGLIYLWDLRQIRRQLAAMGLDWHQQASVARSR